MYVTAEETYAILCRNESIRQMSNGLIASIIDSRKGKTGKNVRTANPDRSINWEPPDSNELYDICNALNHIMRRIWCLRHCIMKDAGEESSRIHRLLTSRKAAIEKAYKKGLKRRKKRKMRLREPPSPYLSENMF